MKLKKNLIVIICIMFSVIWVSATLAGEVMKNKSGEILRASAIDLNGKLTTITLERVKPKKPYKLAVLMPPVYNPYWVIIAYGVVNEAEIMGLPKPTVMATKSYQSLDQQATQMEDVLTMGVDAVLIGPLSYEGSAEMIARAAKKVPIISVAQGVKTDSVSCTVETDNFMSGRLAAEYIVKESGGKAKVGMLKGPPGASWSTQRVKAAKEVFAKYPGIEVAAEKWSSHERAETLKITEDFLTRVPDLDWIWDCVGPMGQIRALEMAGKIGRVKLATTTTYLREVYQAVANKKVSIMVSDHPTLIGRVAVQQAISVLNGELKVKHIFPPNGAYHLGNLETFDETLAWAPVDFRP